jgi:uncharacterized membrane protein
MTTDDELKSEPSLMRCWLKKSYSVSVKVGMYLGGFAVAAIAAYAVWLGVTSQKAAEIWTTFTHWYGSASAILSNFIGSVPWPVWAILAIVGTIVGYSGAWCLARRFTDEDWQSDEAKTVLAAFVLAAFVLAAFAAFVLAVLAAFVLAALAAFVLAALAAFVLADSDPSSSAYFVGRFLGAYLHYKKRIKEVSK